MTRGRQARFDWSSYVSGGVENPLIGEFGLGMRRQVFDLVRFDLEGFKQAFDELDSVLGGVSKLFACRVRSRGA